MSRVKSLMSGGFKASTKRRIVSRNIRRGDGFSGVRVLEEEPNRVSTYIKPNYLDRIIDLKTARVAARSLIKDNIKGTLGNSDFRNLLRNTSKESREDFVQYLFENYGKSNYNRLERSKINLKSGRERSGTEINQDIYLIAIKIKGKPVIQARSRKTGRTVKLNKVWIDKYLRSQ